MHAGGGVGLSDPPHHSFLPSRLQKAPADIMKEQESMLMAKYGGLKPKKKLIPKVRPTWMGSGSGVRGTSKCPQ